MNVYLTRYRLCEIMWAIVKQYMKLLNIGGYLLQLLP